MNHENIHITCMPTDMLDDPTPGSKKIQGTCGHEIWIGPSLANMAEDNPLAQTECLRCTVKNGIKGQPAVTPAQRTELNSLLGVGEVDQLLAEFGIKEIEV